MDHYGKARREGLRIYSAAIQAHEDPYLPVLEETEPALARLNRNALGGVGGFKAIVDNVCSVCLLLVTFGKIANGRFVAYLLLQADCERGTLLVCAFDGYRSAHHVEQLLGQVQAETGSFDVPVAFFVETHKILE